MLLYYCLYTLCYDDKTIRYYYYGRDLVGNRKEYSLSTVHTHTHSGNSDARQKDFTLYVYFFFFFYFLATFVPVLKSLYINDCNTETIRKRRSPNGLVGL